MLAHAIVRIRPTRDQAEFNGVKLSENQIKAWTQASDALLVQAANLASSS